MSFHPPQKAPRTVSEQRRELVLALQARDGDRCWICTAPFYGSELRTLDHVVPRSRGGTRELANLKLAHRVCNSRRGNRSGFHVEGASS